MKVKLNINGEEVEVTLTPEQIASIEKQKKPKKFEFKYCHSNWLVTMTGKPRYVCDGAISEYIEHGRYRTTKEAVEQSLARNKRANRLEALAEQLGGLKKFELGKVNYYVFHNDVWNQGFTHNAFYPERVYMTKECAIEICRMLNDGEFSLEGEFEL